MSDGLMVAWSLRATATPSRYRTALPPPTVNATLCHRPLVSGPGATACCSVVQLPVATAARNPDDSVPPVLNRYPLPTPVGPVLPKPYRKYGVRWSESTNTSMATVAASAPARRLSGRSTYPAFPPKDSAPPSQPTSPDNVPS